MAEELKVRDIVRLPSEQAWMTVEGIQDETVFCSWLNKQGERKRGEFLKDMLIKVQPDTGPTVIGQNVIDRLDPERRHFPKV
jgi:uncharacterized protein YodC (DUF2158 family)